MTSTTMHRRAHLETVIEFELDPDPVQAASRDLGGRASHLRRLLAVTGVTIGLATAASIGAGIATASSPAHPPAASTASPHEPVGASCHAVGSAATGPGEPHLRCMVPVLAAPPSQGAAELARARAQAHGPGAGTHRRWAPADEPVGPQRTTSP